MMFLCRHGAHINNILTGDGIAEVRQSVVAVAKAIADSNNLNGIVLVSSPQPRAVQSADIYAEVFAKSEEAGIGGIIRLDPDHRLDMAVGLAEAIKEKHLPAYKPGHDCMQTWFLMTQRKAEEIGVEFWGYVANRARSAIDEIQLTFPNHIIVAVCHGGVIEPLLSSFMTNVFDLPSGAVVRVLDNNLTKCSIPTRTLQLNSGTEHNTFLSMSCLTSPRPVRYRNTAANRG